MQAAATGLDVVFELLAALVRTILFLHRHRPDAAWAMGLHQRESIGRSECQVVSRLRRSGVVSWPGNNAIRRKFGFTGVSQLTQRR